MEGFLDGLIEVPRAEPLSHECKQIGDDATAYRGRDDVQKTSSMKGAPPEQAAIDLNRICRRGA